MEESRIIVSLGKADGNRFVFRHPFNRCFLAKKGVWALLGKTNKESGYVCLNVGKSTDIGREVLYDLSCLMLSKSYEETGDIYINQFGEYCGFTSKKGETQECLYPHLAETYDDLVFVMVHECSDSKENGEKERKIAHKYHALYWRNGKAFKNSQKESFQIDSKNVFESVETFLSSLDSGAGNQ